MMKKLFLKLLMLSILLVAAMVGIIFLLPYPENSYSLAIIDKHQRLAAAESPKLVLIGGSNLAFSIDSAAIQEKFDLPVVNMGVHAGFGLGRMLDDISPFLYSGDILLVIPEYSHFTDAWNGEIVAYNLIFDARHYRLLFSPRYGLPAGFGRYVSGHLQAFISRFRPPDPLAAYSRDGFNEYGDYVKHLGAENRTFASEKKLEGINKSYLSHFFALVDDFTRRGITVLLSWPNYEEQSWRNSAAFIQELDAIFRAKENLAVISKPESYCFEKNLFYDTAYHLNAEGRALRTARLIADMEAAGLAGRYVP